MQRVTAKSVSFQPGQIRTSDQKRNRFETRIFSKAQPSCSRHDYFKKGIAIVLFKFGTKQTCMIRKTRKRNVSSDICVVLHYKAWKKLHPQCFQYRFKELLLADLACNQQITARVYIRVNPLQLYG